LKFIVRDIREYSGGTDLVNDIQAYIYQTGSWHGQNARGQVCRARFKTYAYRKHLLGIGKNNHCNLGRKIF
jgi:hypothetical protein